MKLRLPSGWTKRDQKVKVIEEIVEFYQEKRRYEGMSGSDWKKIAVLESVKFELADVVLASCTLLVIRGRTSVTKDPNTVRCGVSPMDWIAHVAAGGTEAVIYRAFEIAEKEGYDLITAMRDKIDYNKTREDWGE
jgi:hypothetical protein